MINPESSDLTEALQKANDLNKNGNMFHNFYSVSLQSMAMGCTILGIVEESKGFIF
jgi:hypothetical protein